METVRKHEIQVATLGRARRGAFLELIDRGFGCEPGQSMRQVCPTALHEENAAHHYGLSEDGQLVSTAAALRRPWQTSWGRIDVAVVGCFATRPNHRGRGYSRRVQEFALEDLRRAGCDVAVLWTEQAEVYRGRGFVPCGQETHLDLGPLTREPSPGVRHRRANPEDAPALDALYRLHGWRAERRESDWQAYLEPGVSEVLVAENEEGILAYAALGKGMDFSGYVHEFGGPAVHVHGLWGRLQEEGAGFALIPDGAEAYLEGAAATCPRRSQSSAWGVPLSDRLHGSDLADWRFAAWGFDSA